MMVSPMCMYSGVDGFATNFHVTHLGARALGGFGLIMQEATAISLEGRITYRDLGIWKDEHRSSLKSVVDFCHSQGAKVGIQLAHAGRKASHRPPFEGRKEINPEMPHGWQTVAPSAIPFHPSEHIPIALDDAGINKVKEDFVAATKRAKAIGYDVVEIHAAHGYLLHQFYSPISNQRTDNYGGSFENRIRLLLEVTQLVKAEWGSEKPLFVRISATEWMKEGWSIENSIQLAKQLKKLGVDLIDTSTGGNISAAKLNIPIRPSYQVTFAAQIKQQAHIPTACVGLITKAEQSEAILQNHQADLVAYARESLRNPHLPLVFAKTLAEDIGYPQPYEWAIKP